MPNYSTDRRGALKILGAIGATCAHPFAGDELFGQTVPTTPHEHELAETSTTFLRGADFSTMARVTDLIIPRTNTPGAIDADVPAYVDRIVSGDSNHQELVAEGLRFLAAQAQAAAQKPFLELIETQQLKILEPLCEAWDNRAGAPVKLPRSVQFFGLMKSLTADGYYTSRPGLIEELRYRGNHALSAFPGCQEH
jgi:gluconate 2-dehydrogenase gamma chain